MTIKEVKSKLGFDALNLKPTDNPDWKRHWDNDDRIAVSIHVDLAKEIANGGNPTTLGIQTEKRSGDQGEYLAHRIVKYEEPEFVL